MFNFGVKKKIIYKNLISFFLKQDLQNLNFYFFIENISKENFFSLINENKYIKENEDIFKWKFCEYINWKNRLRDLNYFLIFSG